MRLFVSLSAAALILSACASQETVPGSKNIDGNTYLSLSSSDVAHIEDVFMHYDFNGDGTITAYEEKEFLKADWEKADKDGNGYTDSGTRLSKDGYFEQGKLKGDADGDGNITRAEYTAWVAEYRY